MGQVWAARRLEGPTDELVALKTLRPQTDPDPHLAQLFLDEIRLARLLVHPNVTHVLEVGDDRGWPFLIMEWIEGGTLAELLAHLPQHRLPVLVACEIARQICDALHSAHELSDESGHSLLLVHRDVSPDNILLGVDGELCLSDFGIARARGQLHAPTETGHLKGKLSYMAPEQLSSKSCDRRADVFALGCVLYQATTGQRPFFGDDPLQTMYRLLESDLELPSRLVASYPAHLEQLVCRALAKDPAQRTASALQLGRELAQILDELGGPPSATELGALVERVLSPRIAERRQRIDEALFELDNPTESLVPAPIRRRRVIGWLGGTAVGLAALATVGFFVGQGRAGRTESLTSQAEAATTSPPATTAPRMVSVNVAATPPDARLFLDGSPLDTNPTTLRVAVGSSLHRLSAVLPGYHEQVRSVSFGRDQDVIMVLSPVASKPVPEARSAPATRSSILDSPPTRPTPIATSRSLDTHNPFEEP